MIIDGIVIAVLLVSAIISFLRGFIRETLTILGVAGGAAAAWAAGPLLSPSIRGWLGVKPDGPPERLFGILPYPILADLLAYGVIFIAVVIVLSIISHIIAESARAVGLGPLDRTLGVVFGLARGLLLLAILYLPVHIGVDRHTKEEWFKDSRTSVYLEALSSKIASLIPQSAIRDIKDTGEKMKNTDVSNSVKERLQQIDLLKADSDNSGKTVSGQASDAPGGAGPAAPGSEKDGGYSQEFRDKMKDLFKQDAAPSADAVKTK